MNTSNCNHEFEALLEYLKYEHDWDLTSYKRFSLMRGFRHRMQLLKIDNYGKYLEYLKVQPEELVHLFDTILINFTGFFRDPNAWSYIASEIIPQIIARKAEVELIRIWSAACASGEEAYSLCMLLAENIGIEQVLLRVKIYATDVDEKALSLARCASYSDKEVMDIPPALLEKYFEPIEQRYVFHRKLRQAIIFGCHNLAEDAPISRIDLLVCRNVLIYFNTETQAKILVRFHFALNDNGFLFLGKAESCFTHSDIFTPTNLKQRIFTKVQSLSLQNFLLLKNQTANKVTDKLLSNQVRIWKAAFETSPIAQMLVAQHSCITAANKQARVLFDLTPEKLDCPWQDLASYRLKELRSCINQLYTFSGSTTILRDMEWLDPKGKIYLDVQMRLILDPNGISLGVSLAFTDVTYRKQLTQELERCQAKLEMSSSKLDCENCSQTQSLPRSSADF